MAWISSFIKWLSTPFGGGPTPGTDPKVDAIQAAAVSACGFLPLAETVIGVVGAASPGAITAASAARYICNIVQRTPPVPQPMTLTGGPDEPRVQTWIGPDGTVIRGSFVKPKGD